MSRRQFGCLQINLTTSALTSVLSAQACRTLFPKLSVKLTSAPADTRGKKPLRVEKLQSATDTNPKRLNTVQN